MSMNAMFVQVSDAEIAQFERNPDSVESLFADESFPSNGLLQLTSAMQERLRATGPQMMAASLAQLPDSPREQIEASLGRTRAALAAGQGGEDILKLMQSRMPKPAQGGGRRETISLDKAWHGVHFLLSGTVEPGEALLSQVVLGGTEIGHDPEGFSGYGPARYFRSAEVTAIRAVLGAPELEREAAGRFDAARMTALPIYPGWRDGGDDREWVLGELRRLRDFYSNAAERGRGVVTCLV